MSADEGKPVVVLALDGAMASSVAITCDVLDTANRLSRRSEGSPQFDVTLVGSAGVRAVSVTSDSLVIVPGLAMTTEGEVDRRILEPDIVASGELMRTAVERGAEVAASCAGVFALAEAGLLDGRRCTTTWWLAPVLLRRYPAVHLAPAELVVSDGPITTAGAAMAQLDLMLTLVARCSGEPLARLCARYLAVDRRRSQSRYVVLEEVAGADQDVEKALLWAKEHLAEGISVDDLAASVHLSPRTLARRMAEVSGFSPARFLRRLRIERAVELLHDTDRVVDDIAREVGYVDPSALRRAMRQELGLSPREVRRQRIPAH